MATCFFIGHADTPSDVQKILNEQVCKLITQWGVREFIVGNYGNFDRMATVAVQQAKQKYPDIVAYKLTAYFPGERSCLIPEHFDGIYYPEGMETVPKRFCIPQANRKMVEECDFLVAYVLREGGNAGKLVHYAKHHKVKKITVINLAQ